MPLAPDSARAHQLLGEAHAAQDRTAEAEAEYKAALEKSPGSVELLVALGDLTRRSRASTRRSPYYARAAATSRPPTTTPSTASGSCHSYQRQQAKAVESCSAQALRVEPKSAPAHLALGISLLQTGQAQEP